QLELVKRTFFSYIVQNWFEDLDCMGRAVREMNPNLWRGRAVTKEDLRWALSVVKTRGFAFEGTRESTMLIPLADFLNHNMVASVRTATLAEDALRFVATKDVMPGDVGGPVGAAHCHTGLVVAGMSEMKTGNVDFWGVKRKRTKVFEEPTDAAGWASRAFRAYQSSSKAVREAKLQQAEAEKHAEIARASMKQAEAAMLQSRVNAVAYAVKSPSVLPYVKFCGQLAKRLKALRASDADGSANLEMRRFCAGLENFLDASARRPETLATRAGLRLYDVPPLEYPAKPQWMPSVPSFHVPAGLSGAAAAKLAQVKQLGMPESLLMWQRAEPWRVSSCKRRTRSAAFF
ncbi:unnamed protein product, partial [Effrenium voratum]